MNSKARPKGHIAVKSAEVHPKTSSKNTSHNATLLRFAIIVPIIGKHEERLDASCISEGFLPEPLVFPLTTFQSTIITGAPNNGFLLHTLITLFRLSRVLLDV